MLGQIWAPKKFFVVLSLLDVRRCRKLHYMQFQGKSMIQTQHGEKPHFDSNLLRKFFLGLKNLASSVTRYHGQLSSCTISKI